MLYKDRILIAFLLALFLCLLIRVNFPKFSDVSCSSPMVRTEDDFVVWVREQQQRKAKVAKVCAEDPTWKDSWLRSPNYWQYSFLYNQEHSLLGCLQPKVKVEGDKTQVISKLESFQFFCSRLDQQPGISILCLWQIRERTLS